MNKQIFDEITKKVIANFEGGYFHPNMRTANPKKFGVYHRSGETMFGLDRWAGHDLYYKTPIKRDKKGKPVSVLEDLKNIENNVYEYKSPAAKEFWQSIDNVNAKKNWTWLYRGGTLEKKLTDLASTIMYEHFVDLLNRFIPNKENQKIIESSPKLLFHFSYAAWNGSGWFQIFANKFNAAVKINKDFNYLINNALNNRINSSVDLISRSGKQMKKFFEKNLADNSNNGSPIINDNTNLSKNAGFYILSLVGLAAYYFLKK